MARDYESIVKGLFAKANAEGVTPDEKEALETKAFELMARYGVSRVTEEDKNKTATHFPVSFSGQWTTRQVSLFNQIARHFNCTVVDATNSKKHGTYYVFGFESDIDSTAFLYSILENQMFAELAWVSVPEGKSTKSYRNAWLLGYTSRIKERLDETKRTAEQESAPGYALALRDRSLAVKDEIAKIIGKTRGTKSTYRGRDAFTSGREAGDRAQFNLRDSVGGRKELGK